jgi:hypothetical protein
MPSPTTAASLKINTVVVPGVLNASVTNTRQQIDTTAIGDSCRFHTQGFLEGTVSCELFIDTTNTSFLTAISAGSQITDVEVVWASGASIKGKAFVTQSTVTVAPNDVARATFELVFSGSGATAAGITIDPA